MILFAFLFGMILGMILGMMIYDYIWSEDAGDP